MKRAGSLGFVSLSVRFLALTSHFRRLVFFRFAFAHFVYPSSPTIPRILHICMFSLSLPFLHVHRGVHESSILSYQRVLLFHHHRHLLLRLGRVRSILPALLDRLDESDDERDSDGSEQGSVDGVLVLVGLGGKGSERGRGKREVRRSARRRRE